MLHFSLLLARAAAQPPHVDAYKPTAGKKMKTISIAPCASASFLASVEEQDRNAHEYARQRYKRRQALADARKLPHQACQPVRVLQPRRTIRSDVGTRADQQEHDKQQRGKIEQRRLRTSHDEVLSGAYHARAHTRTRTRRQCRHARRTIQAAAEGARASAQGLSVGTPLESGQLGQLGCSAGWGSGAAAGATSLSRSAHS